MMFLRIWRLKSSSLNLGVFSTKSSQAKLALIWILILLSTRSQCFNLNSGRVAVGANWPTLAACKNCSCPGNWNLDRAGPIIYQAQINLFERYKNTVKLGRARGVKTCPWHLLEIHHFQAKEGGWPKQAPTWANLSKSFNWDLHVPVW